MTEEAKKRVFYRLHAREKMAERRIAPADVRSVLRTGEVIETAHPEGRPFPTRLVLGWAGQRPLHVLVADDPAGPQYVITVYEPAIDRWEPGFRTRKDQP
ncbi:MAG: DUF4258 domain-containing protein [Egibacteraceae bacterium]